MPHSEFWQFVRKQTVEDGGDTSTDTFFLQKQLGDMEGEVKEMQIELEAIKRDRLDMQKRTYNEPDTEVVKDSTTCGESEFPNDHGELSEITRLREDLMKAKYVAEDERIKREKYEAKLKDLEEQLYNICRSDTSSLSKVYRKLNENETNSMKTQIRDLKDELDELRLTLADKTEQLQEYRVKYLQAQQQVLEQKRQLTDMEYDNKQVSEQIQMEIQKMKIQFEEKLKELAPLPDLLKSAQYELQEAKQMQLLAEDSTQQLSNELKRVNEKLVASATKLYHEKCAKKKLVQDNKDLKTTIDEKANEINELCKVLDEYKCNVVSLQEKLGHQEARYEEKAMECIQLSEQLEDMKNETTRSLNRCKDRSKSMRRSLQFQIAEMEKQLVQTRALCYTTQKERDEVRQRMLIQLNGLHEDYKVVEACLKTFQNQLAAIKKSFASLFGDDIENELSKLTFK
ncbi:hypothetical protein ACJJTC_000961 [Scirpophaga incertulas]